MWQSVVVTVISSLVAGACGWFLRALWTSRTENRDRALVHDWLQSNTRDAHGRSHVDAGAVAKGTHLSADRAQRALMTDDRVYRLHRPDAEDRFSVWRQEPAAGKIRRIR